MSERFRRIFAAARPVIAMAHVPALPGSPLYDAAAGVQGAIDDVRRDLEILARRGRRRRPLLQRERPPVPARGAARARRRDGAHRRRARARGVPVRRRLPVGRACALAVAVACGAAFMREVMPGVYESDMGLWQPDAAALLRERRAYGADDLCVLMNVTPEFASPLGSRPLGVRARSAVVSTLADAILVSGPMAGAEPAVDTVREVARRARRERAGRAQHRRAGGHHRLVRAVHRRRHRRQRPQARRRTWNPVERERVRRFLDAARSA